MRKFEAIITSMLASLGLSAPRSNQEIEKLRTATVQESLAKDWYNIGTDIRKGIEREGSANKDVYEQIK
jgi:hypothetical protein